MLSELHRVLQAGGRLALAQVVSGPQRGDLEYPVPWADGPAESFLVSSEELRGDTEAAGFTVLEWLDGQDLIARIGTTAASGRPRHDDRGTGHHLALVMPDFEPRMATLARNVDEQRIAMVMAVLPRLEPTAAPSNHRDDAHCTDAGTAPS